MDIKNISVEIHKCFWINQKGEPCPWNSISSEKDYCKRHSIYEGKYTKDDIQLLIKCSGCKNMFKKENDDIKQCSKCKGRYTKNKEEKNPNNIKCAGITQNKTQCSFEPVENDIYCEKHQSYKKWKELTESGINVCYNWIKGCFNIVKAHEKSCKTCKEKKNNNNIKNYYVKKEKAEIFNNENKDIKMCELCNVVDAKIKFINDKCPKCYENYKKNQKNRKKTSEDEKLLKKYKKNSLDNDICWNLLDDEFYELIKKNCYYCDKLQYYNEVVVVNNKDGYAKNNCISCCKICMDIVNQENEKTILKKIINILSNNFLIDEELDYDGSTIQNEEINYNMYIQKCPENKTEISEVFYNKIIKKPCAYCGISNANFICRKDVQNNFTIGNVLPCCIYCNNMKKNLSHDDFINKIKNIYDFKILNKKNNDAKITEKIIELCKNIKPIEDEKFKYNNEYYENIIYKNMNIDDIVNIKVELEFVENKKQKDIWNYYRKSVSSLKKYENAKMLGRQIYILVKDNLSKKYLGILSLSSDNYNYEDRDKYIGWSYKDKSKINHLMNLSTCVPLQPFGFNFNGGKLLASLAFSKEVLEYFNKKYDDHLLGITTTSLYGKSVQYDRLQCLKFVGFTKGNTSHGIPIEVTKLCNEYLKEFSNNKQQYKKKFIILHKTFDKLNISKEDILTANPKGIYFGFTCEKSKNYLCGNIEEIPNPLNSPQKNINEIFKWWINRWAKQRYEHLKLNDKLII